MIKLQVGDTVFEIPAYELVWRMRFLERFDAGAEAERLWGMVEAVGA